MSFNVTTTAKVISSKVLKTENIRWKDLQFIQQDDFKEWIRGADKLLLNSLLKFQFVDPFKVWEYEGVMYCLDGKHRVLDLYEAEKMGVEVPEFLPATFIDCRDMKEASELVLVYSSAYARITEQGLFDFIHMHKLNLEDLKMEILLPGLQDMVSPLPIPLDKIEKDMGQVQWFLMLKMSGEKEANEMYERFKKEGFEVKIIK